MDDTTSSHVISVTASFLVNDILRNPNNLHNPENLQFQNSKILSHNQQSIMVTSEGKHRGMDTSQCRGMDTSQCYGDFAPPPMQSGTEFAVTTVGGVSPSSSMEVPTREDFAELSCMVAEAERKAYANSLGRTSGGKSGFIRAQHNAYSMFQLPRGGIFASLRKSHVYSDSILHMYQYEL